MRLITPGDTTPASVNKYLLPREQSVITVRMHPAMLLGPIALTLGGLVVAGLLSSSVANGNNSALDVIWIAWGLILLYLVWRVAEWSVMYYTVTDKRMILAKGLVVRNVAMMPLTKVTDMSFHRSPLGRLFGYGEFVVESAGQEQALRNVDYLPYPEQLYLEVCGLLFPTEEKRVPCPRCDATGRIADQAGKEVPCPACNGRRTVLEDSICSRCDGRGEITLDETYRQAVCPRCRGRGVTGIDTWEDEERRRRRRHEEEESDD
jgi:membrane protein YdbS with pleckstrin-like domain/DNA-directed RNA polymerase subunit RPC12/RpoP